MLFRVLSGSGADYESVELCEFGCEWAFHTALYAGVWASEVANMVGWGCRSNVCARTLAGAVSRERGGGCCSGGLRGCVSAWHEGEVGLTG